LTAAAELVVSMTRHSTFSEFGYRVFAVARLPPTLSSLPVNAHRSPIVPAVDAIATMFLLVY